MPQRIGSVFPGTALFAPVRFDLMAVLFFRLPALFARSVLQSRQMCFHMYQPNGQPTEVLFMDDTFGMTKYGYRLFTLMARREDGSGVPVAWLITNSEDADRLTLFLRLVVENTERINAGLSCCISFQ